ncbi:helix-turn-helix transcriptional regulator [Engelhardtia mirabilis]|uniref:Lineage-specific thermal regulator protein n=1 Tax=Engelhardtia mirabilis TaxID=2528011 RepID=A0A518BDY4_9BACT|nr:lineage-specific thermal regulator protein [Planctomycetes bacterium Pla133]QDU99525.1 lineage-specific thermal regulator protein [Planctomycetes bacterium Pla86]
MTIRNSLLALLAEQPAHGYGLKSAFEQRTAGTWSLNVGQVYTTLTRLERDGLVEPAAGGEGQKQTWRITDAGRTVLRDWLDAPVLADPPPRDELVLKVLLATATDSIDLGPILHSQRVATLERLQRLTRLKAKADPDQELAWTLLLDALVLDAQAQIQWLDLCEARIAERDR